MDKDNDNTRSFVPLTKGTEIGRYRIIEKIGAGGMGEVYLAEDTELRRKVALKFLPQHLSGDEDFRTRFKREAQAAAKLSHPNIITIYEVGEYKWRPFIAMEYVPGESLRDMLKEFETTFEKAVDIAFDVCKGLEAAHREEVVHRDIKPSNIVIDADGRARILDFGLAAVAGTEKITKTGSTMGTIGYMSPEQVQGKDIDERSDLFSLGVLLYEMITGKMPFRGDSEASVLNSILNDIPEPLARYKSNVPDDVQNIISKLLEKDPELRYQNAAGVISDLKRYVIRSRQEISAVPPKDWWNRYIVTGAVAVLLVMAAIWLYNEYIVGPKPPPEPERKALAVLPFENLGNPDDEYFADGITDEITARLAGIQALRVTSRTSAMQYKKTDKSAKIIGEELGVDFLLEGTIRWDKTGDTSIIRITPQLIRVSDDSHVWANTFERALTRIFEVQADIARTIADTLGVALLDREQRAIKTVLTQNMDAYNYYLRGKEYWNQRYTDRALEMFIKAVELDSNFYQSYCMLARIYGFNYINEHCISDSCLQLAKNAAEKTVRLAKGNPEGNIAMGYFHYYCSRDYERALEQFELAMAKQPNNSELFEAVGYVHRRQGSWEEALANMRKAYQLDPRNGSVVSGLMRTLYYLHRLDEAREINDEALEWNPESEELLVWQIFFTLYMSGDSSEIYSVLNNFENKVGRASSDYWLEKMDIIRRDYRLALSRRPGIGDYIMADSIEYYMTKGEIYSYLGDSELYRIYYDSVRMASEKRLAENPDNAWNLMGLASALACLGRNEEAVRKGKAAAEMMPLSKDALDGASMMFSLAGIYIRTGEHEKAIDLIEYLLEMPSTLQVSILKLHPLYDPLRDNPRFQALLEKYQ